MKKLLSLAILLSAFSGYSQGVVNFRNDQVFQTTDASGGNRLVYDAGSPLNPTTGVPLVGTQWVAELWAGNDVSSLAPVANSLTRFRATTTVNKGKWGTTSIAGTALGTLPIPFAVGNVVTLQVKVWDQSGASSATGLSTPFTYKSADPTGIDPRVFLMENMQAFALVVPEPSAIALGVLGVAGLLLIRRRK